MEKHEMIGKEIAGFVVMVENGELIAKGQAGIIRLDPSYNIAEQIHYGSYGY